MDDIAFKYDEKKNPTGTWVDGVSLNDLTVARFKKLPKHLQAAVKAQPYYVAVGRPDTKGAAAGPKLTDIDGIGPKTAEKLAAIGILTLPDLVEHLDDANVERIAEKTGTTPQGVVAWQARAMAILDAPNAEDEEE